MYIYSIYSLVRYTMDFFVKIDMTIPGTRTTVPWPGMEPITFSMPSVCATCYATDAGYYYYGYYYTVSLS